MKKIVLIIYAISILTLVSDCAKKSVNDADKKISNKSKQNVEKPEGLSLAEIQCFICHSSTASEKERAAPPMIGIKARYLEAFKNKDEFVNAIVEYAKNPTKENSKIPNALERFGIMPKQNFKDEELKKIAEYIYDYKIQEPDWFREHYKVSHGKEYIQQGLAFENTHNFPKELALKYAMETKELLGKNLQQKLKNEGPEKALTFCNLEAIPLTESMVKKHHTLIKRVSDQPRNINNAANESEREIIARFKKMLAKGETPKPIEENGNLNIPIITNSMCLKCHGSKNTDIEPKIVEKISELYPKDRATGYKKDQIRGIFVVKIP